MGELRQKGRSHAKSDHEGEDAHVDARAEEVD